MVVLYILLGIIAAIVLLFCVKITVELQYSETFTLDLKVLFIKINFLYLMMFTLKEILPIHFMKVLIF